MRVVCAAVPAVLLVLVSGCASAGRTSLPGPGHAIVSHLPRRDGLQYCIYLTPAVLAPKGATSVNVNSLSVYLTSRSGQAAVMAIRGRYPGWDTPGTTIYQMQFSGANQVDLEYDHTFQANGLSCTEVYGSDLIPSTYGQFTYREMVGYNYRVHNHGYSEVKMFPVRWGAYQPQYAPRVRPKH